METLTVPVIGAVLRLLVVIAGFAVLNFAGVLTPDNALIVIAISMVAYGASVALGLHMGPWSAKLSSSQAGQGNFVWPQAGPTLGGLQN